MAQRVLMAVTALLVVGAASTAVATSGGSTAAGVRANAALTTGATPPSAQGGNAGAKGAPANGAGAPPAQTKLTQAADPSGQLRFVHSTLAVRAGKVSFEFTNRSPLPHNLTIAQGNKVLGATPTFNGGARMLTLTLKPGTYKFFCSVPGHREAGMEGTLGVS